MAGRRGVGACGARGMRDSKEAGLAERARRSSFQLFLRDWLPVMLYVTVILTLSAQPNLKPPINWQGADKFYHLAEYGGFGLLLGRAFRDTLPARRIVLATLIAIFAGAAFGAFDEYFQSFIPGRESSVYDFIADSAGVILAQMVALLVARD
jgi:VanZ family protein